VPRTSLAGGAAALGLALAPDQLDRFERYCAALIDWNRRVNLTAIVDPIDVARKHFLDSLSVLSVCEIRAGDRLVDVGSGAGFPGLPIRIARPGLQVTLLEATRKKCEFLRHVVAALDLSDVAIVNARAEDAARDAARRERYDWALARAVADLAALVEYLLPFVRVGGRVAAQKSGEVGAEVERAGAAIAALGGRLQRVAPVSVPGLEEARCVIVIDKIAPTPEKYPRRAGLPEKRPIR
jgi:16S rRNA (guanine527-N7)-methyltransferase